MTGFGFVGYSFNTPIDLSSIGAFEFTILNNDQAGAILLTAIDSLGNESQYQYAVPLPAASPGDVALTTAAR